MKQTKLPSMRCSIVDSFRFLCMTFLPGGLAVGLQDLALQHGDELALESLHLAAAHTFLVDRKVEAHVSIDRIRNQAECSEIEGMDVHAQVFEADRDVAAAGRNIAERRIRTGSSSR